MRNSLLLTTLIFFFSLSSYDHLFGQATNKIDTVGSIGIGTTSPAFKLDVAGDARVVSNLYFGSVENPTRNQLSKGFYRLTAPNDLNTLDVTVSNSQIYFASNFYGGGLSIPISINTYPNNNQLFLETNGNVGIGTSTPTERLSVIGNISANAFYSANNIEGQQMRLFTVNGGAKLRFTSSNYGFAFEQPNDAPSFRLTRSDNASNVLQSWDGIGNTFIAGNLGIGTELPSEKLVVNGNVRAKKLIVAQTGWSDYVFNDNYKLRPLREVSMFIKDNKHLPEVPSAKEVEEKGLDLGANQAVLLKKIEELTLYIIGQQKRIEILEKQMSKK